LSRNVGNELAIHAALIVQKSADLKPYIVPLVYIKLHYSNLFFFFKYFT